MSQELTRINEIKSGLVAAQKQITSLLKDDAKAKQFIAGALVVANSKSLSQCTPDSIVQSLVGIALSDLNIDPNIGHCYLVPYWSPNGSTAQLQLGYKGFIQLLFRAGWLVKGLPVYICDKFEMSFNGWDNAVNFIPAIDERDEGDPDWCFDNLRGIYVVARHADTKDEFNIFVSRAVIEKLRLTSANQKINKRTSPEDKVLLESGRPVGIWKDWYIEMATSKAIKKLAKLLPIGDKRVQMSVIMDDKSEIGQSIDYIKTFESDVIVERKPENLRNSIEKELEEKTEEVWE